MLLNAKAILVEEQKWYCLSKSKEDKAVHTIPKSLKVNVMARLEFELAYYDFTLQHVRYYTLLNFTVIMSFYKILLNYKLKFKKLSFAQRQRCPCAQGQW